MNSVSLFGLRFRVVLNSHTFIFSCKIIRIEIIINIQLISIFNLSINIELQILLFSTRYSNSDVQKIFLIIHYFHIIKINNRIIFNYSQCYEINFIVLAYI